MTSFRELETQDFPVGSTSLEMWYQTARDKPISEFNTDDMCIALRQNIFLDAIVPVALSLLREDPMQGAQFEGEMIAAFKRIPAPFWTANQELASQLFVILNSIATEDPEIRQDIDAQVRMLEDNRRHRDAPPNGLT